MRPNFAHGQDQKIARRLLPVRGMVSEIEKEQPLN